MKNTLLLLATILLVGIQSHAQNVAINNDGSEPNAAAALDVKASDKGILIPRVDFNNLPLAPPTGLLVFVTTNGPDGNDAFYYYDGTQWQKLPASSSITNNPWAASGSNIYYNSGNVGIGTASPLALLDLGSSTSNRKIILYSASDNDHQFTGFGLNADALRFQLANTSGNFKFYGATSSTASTELFRIQGNGQIMIPALTTAGVLLNSSTGLVSSSVGTSGQVLTTNGSGGITWTTPTGGTVTDVSGTAPIVSTGGAVPTISINAATTSEAGSMSAADKTKLDGLIGSQWTSSGSNIYYNSGNIGIGTTTPNSKLTFSNNIGDGFDEWTDYQLLLFSGVAAQSSYGLGVKANTLAFNSDRDYDFDQDGSTVMTIQEGKVGIGTESPRAMLDLGNSISNRKIMLFSSADNDHQFTGIGLNADALRFQLTNTSGNFKFYGATSSSASTELFRIQGNGQIMIPALTTAGVLLNSSAGLVSSSVGTSGQVLTTNGTGGIEWAANVSSQWTTSGSNIYYNTGNVGIGTATANAQLQLGNTTANRKIILWQNTNDDHQFYGLGVNSNVFRLQIPNTSADFKFYGATSSSASAELFSIQGNGQVAIPAMTTAGVVQNSASGILSSTKGTANQVLKMDAAGTATEWASETDPSVPQGTQTGQMQYWNGTAWVTVDAGQNGQILKFMNGVPTWEYDNIINLSVGDSYNGGIIAYFLQPGDLGYDANVLHGIIAAPEDQSTGIQWGCNGSPIPSVRDVTDIGYGELNTNFISALCSTTNIAARLCRDLTLNGYDDWFLPSADEMKQIALNKNYIPGIVSNGNYWTSTEYNENEAYVTQIDSPNGYYGGSKNYSLRVRAIRYF